MGSGADPLTVGNQSADIRTTVFDNQKIQLRERDHDAPCVGKCVATYTEETHAHGYRL